MPDVQLNIREGEEYRLKDLLYSLMLESHNDSAVAIAEYIGGSVEAFADLMNRKAIEVGCTNTHLLRLMDWMQRMNMGFTERPQRILPGSCGIVSESHRNGNSFLL